MTDMLQNIHKLKGMYGRGNGSSISICADSRDGRGWE